MTSPILTGSILDGVADSLQQFSIETILSDDSSWTNQQTSLDQNIVERLSDEDLDALSLSEYYLTIAQFKLKQYVSSDLFQETFIFGLGTGIDFDVDVCRLPEGQLVVVKRVKLLTSMYRSDKSTVSDLSRRVRKVLQEVRILKHPPVEDCDSILDILGVSIEYVNGAFTTPSLVLAYAELGTLRHYLFQEPRRTVQERQSLCIQVGKAILTLHACRICHGDIKLDNVLVVRNGDGSVVAKLADFGSSIIIQADDSQEIYWGTTAYNAPEIRSKGDAQSGISVSGNLLFACDIFSFGLLLFESLHGGTPYWMCHGKNKPTLETALQIGKCDCHESIILQPTNLTSVNCFRNAISLSLILEPEKRGEMKSVFAALSGKDSDIDITNCRQINIRDERPLNIINLADPVTLLVLLTGGGHYMSNHFAPKLPFSVQNLLFSAYQRHCLSTNQVISAFMHLQLAICYFVGFGVGMDMEKAYTYLATAAQSQYHSLRPLLVRMREAFSFDVPEQLLPQINDEMAARNVSILMEAIKKPDYCSPLYEISKTWQETLNEEPDVGSELHIAAYLGDLNWTSQLIQQGYRDHQNESQSTGIMLACIAGSLPVVRVLLENGGDPSLKDENGYTVWHMLVLFPLADIAPAADLFQKNSKCLSVIDAYSASPYELPEMFDTLVGTPLHWAIQTNNILAVSTLLQARARIDIYYPGLLSPIELAASLRLHYILELLLKHASARTLDLNIERPLFSMTECHPFRIVFLHGKSLGDATLRTLDILVKHWDINTLNSLSWTPILKACLVGFSVPDKDLVLTMLQWADEYVEGQLYPAVVASILGCTNNEPSNAILPLELIARGISVTASTSGSSGRGYNALHWATACLNTKVIQAILQLDPTLANVPTNSPAGEYPLNIAAGQDESKNLLSTLQILVGAGANPKAGSREHCLTALGSFVSEQPAEFDASSLRYLLSVSKDNRYLARNFRSNPWTALHLATDLSASFAILGNMKPLNILRRLLQFEEIKGLLEIRTEDGLTPILQAAFRVDYPTIRVLVEAGADITTKSHEGGTCMSVLLENALYPLAQLSKSFPVSNFNAKWRHNAYRSALYICERLRKIQNYPGLVLPKLHIAAYMCHSQEVNRLIESREGDVYETLGEKSTTTARMLLEGMLKMEKRKSHPLPEETIAEARDLIEYLKLKEAVGHSA